MIIITVMGEKSGDFQTQEGSPSGNHEFQNSLFHGLVRYVSHDMNEEERWFK